MAAITTVSLTAAFPEWANADSGALASAVLQANSLALDLYTNDDEDTYRRHLEASAILYHHPYARVLNKDGSPGPNHYRLEADRMDRLKGTAWRAPGWTLPSGVV